MMVVGVEYVCQISFCPAQRIYDRHSFRRVNNTNCTRIHIM
uniref:Uncharacterized protein n=1 Tax=Lotus japonicus TaxID=34305 RepID=I3S061_LOTJA|nr:unknown [Lotus japonicus]